MRDGGLGKIDGVSGTDRKCVVRGKTRKGAPRSGGGRLMNLGGSARQSASPNQFSQKKKVHGPTCGGRHPKHPSHGALSTTGTGVRCGCGWGQLRRLHNKRMPGGSRPVRCQAVLAPFWKVERRKWGRSGARTSMQPTCRKRCSGGATPKVLTFRSSVSRETTNHTHRPRLPWAALARLALEKCRAAFPSPPLARRFLAADELFLIGSAQQNPTGTSPAG